MMINRENFGQESCSDKLSPLQKRQAFLLLYTQTEQVCLNIDPLANNSDYINSVMYNPMIDKFRQTCSVWVYFVFIRLFYRHGRLPYEGHSLRLLNTYKFFFIFPLFFLFAGCQHGSKLNRIALPSAYRPYFSTCRDLDGVFSGRAFSPSQLYFSGEMEWTSKGKYGWLAAFLNPGGLSEATVAYNDQTQRVSIEGVSNTKDFRNFAEKIEIDDHSFLSFDGHRIGLQASELTCIFSGILPMNWVDELRTITQDGSQNLEFYSSQNLREIKILLPRSPEAKSKICGLIEWTEYLGIIRNTLEVCISGPLKNRLIVIRINGDNFTIEGKVLDV